MILNDRFKVLNGIALELQRHGLEFSVEPGTICIGREQWDRFTQQSFRMHSAAPIIVQGNKSFFVFASEQYDATGTLMKYSIRVCDSNKRSIRAWELDTKRGKHAHEYPQGRKRVDHIPRSGTLEDIADEIFAVVRLYDPAKGKVEDGLT